MKRVMVWHLLGLLFCLLSGAAVAVDANTASSEELQTIRGIGPAMAARILEERRRGAFRDADDLRERVRGIGVKNLGRMRAAGLEVRAGDQTTAAVGAGRMNETMSGGSAVAVDESAAPRPRVEYHIGRAR